jgi:hypothetical protein
MERGALAERATEQTACVTARASGCSCEERPFVRLGEFGETAKVVETNRFGRPRVPAKHSSSPILLLAAVAAGGNVPRFRCANADGFICTLLNRTARRT